MDLLLKSITESNRGGTVPEIETKLAWLYANSINSRHPITLRTVLHEMAVCFGRLLTDWKEAHGKRPANQTALEAEMKAVSLGARRLIEECGANPALLDQEGKTASELLVHALPLMFSVSLNYGETRFVYGTTLALYEALSTGLGPDPKRLHLWVRDYPRTQAKIDEMANEALQKSLAKIEPSKPCSDASLPSETLEEEEELIQKIERTQVPLTVVQDASSGTLPDAPPASRGFSIFGSLFGARPSST